MQPGAVTICMSVDCFLDTNVLVYAAAGKESEEAKRQRALVLIEEENFGLSVQVLQEFYVTVCRKIERPLSAEQALEWIEQLEVFPSVLKRCTARILITGSNTLQCGYVIRFKSKIGFSKNKVISCGSTLLDGATDRAEPHRSQFPGALYHLP